MSAPRAVVVTVGDELLLGETVDTNAAWLGRRLASLGVRVVRRRVVGDEEEEIHKALADATGDADAVLLTGGLGPTADDLTREAVARHLGRPLQPDQGLVEALTERFRARGFDTLPEKNLSQAQVPRGAEALENPWGTAPGLLLETDEGRLIVLLPGVPKEMKGIFDESVAGRIRERFGDRLEPVVHRVLSTTGISESVLAEEVEKALPEDTGPVSVAFLPDVRGVQLRLTARGVPSREAEDWLDRIEDALRPVLGRYRFEASSGDLVEAVARALQDRGWTLATGESCTGGLVSKRITDRAGSSGYFLGGVVAYSNRSKSELLGVAVDLLEAEGAVSEAVAGALARGAARRFGADAGIGITGIAGPAGGSSDKPVGMVCYAAHVAGETVTRLERFQGDREQVRERSAQAALALLLRALDETGA